MGALDAMLIYETDGVPTTAQMGGWHTKYPASNFGVIPYATPFNASFVATARKYVGYIYLQNDYFPNPWYILTAVLRRPARRPRVRAMARRSDLTGAR